jgi:hypothetical protein
MLLYLRIFLAWLRPEFARPKPKRTQPPIQVYFVPIAKGQPRWSLEQIERSLELDSTKPRSPIQVTS